MREPSQIMQQLADAARGGWDGIEDPDGLVSSAQKQAEAMARNTRRTEARLFLETFDTPAGRKVLELLQQTTFKRPPDALDMDERDPMAFALRQARRMGAANVVHWVESQIAFARDETKEDV